MAPLKKALFCCRPRGLDLEVLKEGGRSHPAFVDRRHLVACAAEAYPRRDGTCGLIDVAPYGSAYIRIIILPGTTERIATILGAIIAQFHEGVME